VRDGESLSDCMIRELSFRGSEAWILHATGGTGEFPSGLRDVAQICRELSERHLTLFRECALPILVLLEGMAVVLATAGVFLPLTRLPLMF
jgi:type II secretory pathway component PulF